METDQSTYYTREGDTGQTRLGAHGDVSKHDVRVIAYAECDEANAAVSVAMAVGGLRPDIIRMLSSVQNDLFDLVADLAVPTTREEPATVRIVQGHISRLERAIDHFAQDADDLSGMVLPGGTIAAAILNQGRGVVRRAERAVWMAVEEHPESMNPMTARYLNRLSALLFVLARGANAEHGDVTWEPGASVRTEQTNGSEATS